MQDEITHPPVEHAATAFARLQTLEQAPQFEALVLVLTSHPLVRSVSQLENPAVQLMPQAPTVQVPAPFVLLHTVPQALQFCGSFFTLTSQPSDTRPLQFAKLAEQPMLQTPAVQKAVPFALLQTVAQLLQWAGSPFRLISQPFDGRPSQSAKPALHAEITQTPALQPDVAFARLHTLPQVPQLLTVVLVLVSQPLLTLPSQLL